MTDADYEDSLKKIWGFLALTLCVLSVLIPGILIFEFDSVPMLIIEFFCVPIAAIAFIYLSTTFRRLPCYKLPTVPLIHAVIVGVPVCFFFLFLVKDTAVSLSSNPLTILNIHKIFFILYIILGLLGFAMFFALIRKARKESSRL